MNYIMINKGEYCGECSFSNELTVSGNKYTQRVPQKLKKMFDTNVKYCHELPPIRFINLVHPMMNYLNGTETRTFDGYVTILIPCYKKSHFIKTTVLSCVNQTYPVSVNVLLMDEDSIKLKGELESLGNVKCYISDQMNVVKARTYLVNNCKTDWFMFLDADDTLDPDCVSILSNADGAVRYPNCNMNEYSGIPCLRPNNITNIAVYNNTAMMHKDVFYSIGYDETLFRGGEDSDFNHRLLGKRRWKISYVPETRFNYNVDSENQLTKNFDDFNESLIKSFVKNSNIIKSGLEKSCVDHDSKRYILKALDGFSKNRMYALVAYIEEFNIVNFLTDNLRTLYENKLYKAAKPSVVFHGGRIKCLDDVIYKSQHFDASPELKEKLLGMDDIQRLFYLLDNYICSESDDVNDREVRVMEYDEALSFVCKHKFPKELKEDIDVIREIADIQNAPEYKHPQPINFVFNKTCNERCEYCVQKGMTEKLSDDELYERFDKALSYFEKLTDNNVFPGILGGETSLMSDYLTDRLIKRLENYKRILIFTNGFNRKSKWFSLQNATINEHLVHWTEMDSSKLKYQQAHTYSIVVTKKDINKLDNFMKNIDEAIKLQVDLCHSPDPELNITKEDAVIIKQIVENNKKEMIEINDKNIQLCKQSKKRTWEYDVISDKISPCCIITDKVNLKDWNPDCDFSCDSCTNPAWLY